MTSKQASGVLGYPRIGRARELKWALERFWSGRGDAAALEHQAVALRREAWQAQARSGASWVAVGDFALYDHVLDLALQLGVVPRRFGGPAAPRDLSTYFTMARGRSSPGQLETRPLEMTKWFDTNYHYLVPELEGEDAFEYRAGSLVAQLREARSLGFEARPVVLGPVSFLLLSKDEARRAGPLSRLPQLLPAYLALLEDLRANGATSVQVDEPCLATDLPDGSVSAYLRAYSALSEAGLALDLTSYFGPLADNLELALSLPVQGLQVDGVAAPEEARAAAPPRAAPVPRFDRRAQRVAR